MDGHFVPESDDGAAGRPIDSQGGEGPARRPPDDRGARPLHRGVRGRAGRRRSRCTSEAVPHLHRTVQLIKQLGAKAGVAINPATPVGALEEIAGDVDQVLVMSVNPGFGGQTFIPRTESKIQAVRALLDRRAAGRRSKWTAGSTCRTRPGSSRPAPPFSWRASPFSGPATPERATRDLRAAAEARVRRLTDTARAREAGVDLPCPGPVRGNRQDGGRLLRELLRVVRGGPRGSAAIARLELPGNGGSRGCRCR